MRSRLRFQDVKGFLSIILCLSAYGSLFAQTEPYWRLQPPREVCNVCSLDSIQIVGNEGTYYQVGGVLVDSLNVNSYPDGELWSDLSVNSQKVFVNLEHSYLADLLIELECPNGVSVVLYEDGAGIGGMADLGVPILGEGPGFDGIWGTGFTYTWIDSGDYPTMSEASDVEVNGIVLLELPAGLYAPVESFNQLNGCPLNGLWKFRIWDLLGGDNGYVFFWGFDEMTKFIGRVASGELDNPVSVCIDDGSITVNPAEGIADTYTFHLNSGGSLLQQGDWDGTEELIFSGLLPGSYAVEAYLEDSLLDEVAVVLDAEFNPANSSADVLCAIGFDPELQRNVVLWAKDDTELVASYDVYRESNVTSEFEWIGNVHVDSLSEFVDVSFDPGLSSTRYELVAIDSCGAEIDNSGHHRTIHLQASQGLNGEVNLYWNAYEGVAYPNFSIFRSTDGATFFQIGTVSNSNLAFTDPNPPSGNKWYQVRINLQEPCEPQRSSMIDYIGSNISDLTALGLAVNATRDFSTSLVAGPEGWTVLWGDAQQGVKVTVFDAVGRSIFEQSERLLSGEIPLHLHSGTFLIRVLDLQSGAFQVHRGIF